jgi:hypothetical protein
MLVQISLGHAMPYNAKNNVGPDILLTMNVYVIVSSYYAITVACLFHL